MNIEEVREYCLRKKGVEETFPFGPETMVMKVMGKIFLLAGLDETPVRLNLKCDPERVNELRAKYPSVIPGFHMNKSHWNTVICDGSVSEPVLCEWIDDSYNLIVSGFSKKLKKEFDAL